MRTPVNIMFWSRAKRGEDRNNPAHAVHILCRITARGQRAHAVNFHTNLETQKDNWEANGSFSRVRGRSAADKHINTQLTKLVDTLTDYHADLERQGKKVSARAIYALYRNNGSVLTLTQLYEGFLAERKTLIGIEISASSYDVTIWRQQLLLGFLRDRNLLDLRPEEFSHNMADKFLQWCLIDRGYKRNYANKALQVVSQCLRWGVRREHLEKNPMDLYRYKAAAASPLKFLTVGELQALTVRVLPCASLERVRDCFVFQCWTGLAYVDLAALDLPTAARYHRDGNNILRRVLHVTRKKSAIGQSYDCVIPLLPEAERILLKYEDVLPVPSAPFYNRSLKELGQLCGFDLEKMTTHTGRRTAGVLLLNLGMRMETVSKVLGHSSVKMTEKLYAKILDNTVVDEFTSLFSLPTSGPTPTHTLAPASPLETRLAGRGGVRETKVAQLPAVELRPARRIARLTAEVLPEPPSEDNRWRRPPPTTSRHGANQPSVRVVPMWAEPTTGKEALSA